MKSRWVNCESPLSVIYHDQLPTITVIIHFRVCSGRLHCGSGLYRAAKGRRGRVKVRARARVWSKHHSSRATVPYRGSVGLLARFNGAIEEALRWRHAARAARWVCWMRDTQGRQQVPRRAGRRTGPDSGAESWFVTMRAVPGLKEHLLLHLHSYSPSQRPLCYRKLHSSRETRLRGEKPRPVQIFGNKLRWAHVYMCRARVARAQGEHQGIDVICAEWRIYIMWQHNKKHSEMS